MNREKLMYVAGLMDIGGCIKIESPAKGSRASLYVWVTSKHFELMEELQSIGAHIGKKQDGQYRAKWRDIKAYSILKSLLPFLRVRKEQAKCGIEFFEDRKENPDQDNDQVFRIRLKLLKKDEEGESNAIRKQI